MERDVGDAYEHVTELVRDVHDVGVLDVPEIDETFHVERRPADSVAHDKVRDLARSFGGATVLAGHPGARDESRPVRSPAAASKPFSVPIRPPYQLAALS
jgi:hypothetical protein